MEAIQHGMPPACGLGIGIDRMTMLLTGTKNIKEVIELCLEEKESRAMARAFGTEEVSLHTVSV